MPLPRSPNLNYSDEGPEGLEVDFAFEDSRVFAFAIVLAFVGIHLPPPFFNFAFLFQEVIVYSTMDREINNDMDSEASSEVRLGRHVTWVGFWTNAALSVLKILAGVFGRSSAMIADGVHSTSDLLTYVAVLI